MHSVALIEVQLNEGLEIVGVGAFCGCAALRSVTLPSTVTKLGNGAFDCCRQLIEVKLNEGLQIIGCQAFDGCTTLQSVTIPSTVTVLGN